MSRRGSKWRRHRRRPRGGIFVPAVTRAVVASRAAPLFGLPAKTFRPTFGSIADVDRADGQARVEALLALTVTHDLDEFAGHFIPDFPGIEGLKAWFAQLFVAFPDLSKKSVAVVVDGDWVWAHCRVTGTNTGPFLGHEPTNRSIEMMTVDAWRFKGDKVAEHWDVIDKLTMFQQLGLIPTVDPR